MWAFRILGLNGNARHELMYAMCLSLLSGRENNGPALQIGTVKINVTEMSQIVLSCV